MRWFACFSPSPTVENRGSQNSKVRPGHIFPPAKPRYQHTLHWRKLCEVYSTLSGMIASLRRSCVVNCRDEVLVLAWGLVKRMQLMEKLEAIWSFSRTIWRGFEVEQLVRPMMNVWLVLPGLAVRQGRLKDISALLSQCRNINNTRWMDPQIGQMYSK